MTNLDSNTSLALVELFGTLICFVSAINFKVFTGNKTKIQRSIVLMLVIAGFSLLSDAGWYYADGKTETTFRILNRISNFSIFIFNPLLPIAANLFISNLVKETNHKLNRLISMITHTFVLICLLLPFLNLIKPWMYSYTVDNVYYRLQGWYLYALCGALSGVFVIIQCLINAKYISVHYLYSTILFCSVPLLGIIIQSFIPNTSFISLSMALTCVIVTFNYLRVYLKQKSNNTSEMNYHKNIGIVLYFVSTMTICITVSLASCFISIKRISYTNKKENSLTIARTINNEIESSLMKAVIVSEAIADSLEVKNALTNEAINNNDYDDLANYLHSLKQYFGYEYIFVISDQTTNYIASTNKLTYINNYSEDDSWYQEFRRRNEDFYFAVDESDYAAYGESIYLNKAIYDANGVVQGACGVGISTNSVMKVLEQYTKEYNIDIALVDANGYEFLSTDNESHLEKIDTTKISNNDYEYNLLNKKAIIGKHLEMANWTLIIEDRNPTKTNFLKLMGPSIAVYLIGIILMIAFASLLLLYEKKRNLRLEFEKKMSETDELTKVGNRHALENVMKSLENTVPEPNQFYLILDINGLKTANDTIGHWAGDELIMAAAKCIEESYQSIGQIFRIGGDEFAVIGKANKDLLEGATTHFKKEVAKWSGTYNSELSISLGSALSADYPDMDYEQLRRKADMLMYDDKREYYANHQNDRRNPNKKERS